MVLGAAVGVREVGDSDGDIDGDMVGAEVGDSDGDMVGAEVGSVSFWHNEAPPKDIPHSSIMFTEVSRTAAAAAVQVVALVMVAVGIPAMSSPQRPATIRTYSRDGLKVAFTG